VAKGSCDEQSEPAALRILHVLDHSLPMHSGYTFRTRAILKAQIGRGWDVAGVTGARHTADGPDIETVDGLTFYRSPAPRPAPSPVHEWREIGALADRLDAVVQDWKPDLLHAHSPVLNAIAAQRVAKRRGIPLLYEIRAFWEDAAVGNGTGREGSARYWVTRQLETRAVKQADAVAVICEGLRGDLIARGIGADKIMVSPNGVDLHLFGDPPLPDRALARQLGLEDAEVIGFIGSFYDYEGLDDLIAAMPRLAAERPRARLLLVGGGPMEESLRAQATASPVADRIRFVGRVPHQEVERYYGLTDILAYPRKAMRLTELVTPLKPLEAMAQRRLVAASDVGGHRELIEDGVTGTLFPADDPDALAMALAGLLADRAGWDARRDVARAFVERERNWAANVARYDSVYQRLIKSAA
jgi:glycogen synthase